MYYISQMKNINEKICNGSGRKETRDRNQSWSSHKSATS